MQLTPEKEFKHVQFCRDVQQMDREQAQQFLMKIHHLMLTQEQIFNEMMRNQLGIERQQFGGDRNSTGEQ